MEWEKEIAGNGGRISRRAVNAELEKVGLAIFHKCDECGGSDVQRRRRDYSSLECASCGARPILYTNTKLGKPAGAV